MSEVGLAMAGSLFGLALLIWGAIELDRYSCSVAWDSSGREYKFEVWGGCQIKDGRGWIPAKNYRSL